VTRLKIQTKTNVKINKKHTHTAFIFELVFGKNYYRLKLKSGCTTYNKKFPMPTGKNRHIIFTRPMA